MMEAASVDNKLLILIVYHSDEHEQQVKDEISHGDKSEDSEQEYHIQFESDEDPACITMTMI
jgi:hypothetical protein